MSKKKDNYIKKYLTLYKLIYILIKKRGNIIWNMKELAKMNTI
jgi:hypothetical protein